jgi:O-antigen/teichoic acid export membrane protein
VINKNIKSISLITFGNIFRLLVSVFISFVIPNLLGIIGYGYYKLFILYSTYIGLTHLGFADGIYLNFGGKDYNELNVGKFRAFSKFFFLIQLIIAFIGISFGLLFVAGESKMLVLLLFLYMIPININNYYMIISQITSRFKEYSIRLILLSLFNVFIVSIMFFLNINDYRFYIVLVTVSNGLLTLWYFYTYRNISFGKRESFKDVKHEIKNLFILGVPLLLSNLSTTFVLAVDKQIVNILFPIEVFSIYAFAYSMLSMITVVVSAISVVLYPSLKKVSFEVIRAKYQDLNSIVIFIVLIGLSGFYPLTYLIPRFLPDYTDSLVIFRVALPSLILTSSITAIKHNIYKIKNKNKVYFLFSILAIIIIIGFNIASYSIFKTTQSIAFSTFLGIFIWYLINEFYLVKNYNLKWKKNILLILVGVCNYYLVTELITSLYGFFAYLLITIVIIALFYSNKIMKLFK